MTLAELQHHLLGALAPSHADRVSPNTYCAGCKSATHNCPRCQRHWCPSCGEKRPCK
jgi:hypothetical protein